MVNRLNLLCTYIYSGNLKIKCITIKTTSGADGFAFISELKRKVISAVSNTNNVIVLPPFYGDNSTGWYVRITDQYLNSLSYKDVYMTVWYAE